MILTKEDKEILKAFGYHEKDFAQIEEAIGVTVYKYYTLIEDPNERDLTLKYSRKEEKRISASKALELLGQETFLSGISRSAFHWNCSRDIAGSDKRVSFDSSRLFK